MRRALWFLIPFGVVLTLGLAGMGWSKGWIGKTPPEVVPEVELDLLDATTPYVRVAGMAHYTAVVTQDVPGSMFTEPKTYYLFGLFAPYDTSSRMIRVLVRTTREPDDLVSYELMTVEGWLSRATPDKVPYDVEVILGKGTEYFFADEVLLLEPERVVEGIPSEGAAEVGG